MNINIEPNLWAVEITHRFGSETVNFNTFKSENDIDLTSEQFKKLKNFETIVVQTFLGPTKVKRV